MSEFVSVFDLLADDPSGRGMKQLQEELFDMRASLKRTMDARLSADAMVTARKALDAVQTAEQAVPKLYDAWNR